jgi:hypothetical protein
MVLDNLSYCDIASYECTSNIIDVTLIWNA